MWCVLLATVSISSFFIYEIRLWGKWSPIHLLSIVTLGSIIYAIVAIKNGNIAGHKMAIISVFIFGLLTAGAFTLILRSYYACGIYQLITEASRLANLPLSSTAF